MKPNQRPNLLTLNASFFLAVVYWLFVGEYPVFEIVKCWFFFRFLFLGF